MKLAEQISPALKSWLDNVIVPALVKAYVADVEQRNGIVLASTLGIKSLPKEDPSSEGNP